MVTGNRRAPTCGAQIVDLRQARVGRIEQAVQAELETGHMIVKTTGLNSVEEWRAAVRHVARAQGWRVRTGVTHGGQQVWAVRTDLEPSPAQAERDRERIRYLGAVITK